MSDLTVVGPVALPARASATLTVRYLPGWRDSLGRLSAGQYVGRYAGGAWVAAGVGGALLLPAGASVHCTLVVQVPGLPPAVQSFTRWVRDTGGGAWDFTLGDGSEEQPVTPPASGGAVPGAPGERGEAGLSFRQGPGAPGVTLGIVGDSYLDSTTSDLYLKTGAGWLLTGTLRGRPGVTGQDGPTGPRGFNGTLRPAPTLPAQEGFVPVASETAGENGWAWEKPPSGWLARLRDVDLTDLQDGHTLVWSAATKKWKPGKAAGGTTPPPAPVALENGMPITVAGAVGSRTVYTVTIPPGTGNLTINTSGGTGDMDVYVRYDTPPEIPAEGPPTADAKSAEVGNNETATVANPAPGTWYVTLHAYEAYTGVTLTAMWGGVPTATPLAVTVAPDGSLSSNDPRITTNPDGSLSAPDELITVNDDGSLSEV